jgi:hypothetical protein
MPGPLLAEVFGGLAQAYLAPRAAFDALQHLIHTRPLGEPAKLAGEELLQGLAASLSPALQSGVNVVGKISYQQIWHAYIMQASCLLGKAAHHRARPDTVNAER